MTVSEFIPPDRLVLNDGRELTVHFDEARVPSYTLPDPLVLECGEAVRNVEGWRRRRAEILELFRTHVYGRNPDAPVSLHSEVLESEPAALGGRAVREQVRLRFGQRGEFLAAKAAEPVYGLLGSGGLDADRMPEIDQSTGNVLAYHIRSGGHDLSRWEWLQYLAFADRHLS